MAQGQNWPDAGDVPGVPKSSLGWLVAVIVGGLFLVIGIVVVFVVLR